jgi:hypothetical protein
MTDTTTPQLPAAWFPDPDRPGGQRYFDGTAWTEDRFNPASPPPAPPPAPVGATPSASPPKRKLARVSRTFKVAGLILFVIGLLLYAIGGGKKGTPAPASSGNLTAVCNATAQVAADYNDLGAGTAVPTLNSDVQSAGAQALLYGDPFKAEWTTAVAAGAAGDSTAMLAALDTMANSCTSAGYTP